MFDIKEIKVSMDNEMVQKMTSLFKDFWTGIPVWLRSLLVITVVIGAMYFLYNRVMVSYDMDELQREVKELNEKCATTVFYDRYVYDIHNVVVSVKTIENIINQMYRDEEAVLNLFEQYVNRNHPGDPIIKEIEKLKKQSSFAKDSYERILEHQISIYDNFDGKNENTKIPQLPQ